MRLKIKKEEFIYLYTLYLDCKGLIEYRKKGESFEFMQEHILERMEKNLKRYENEN